MSQIVIFQDRVYAAGANRILKPPSFSKYLSWGFSDRSLRIISYEQEKLLSTHENLHDDGMVLCAGFSRDGRILVTGNCTKHCDPCLGYLALFTFIFYHGVSSFGCNFIYFLTKYITTDVDLSGIKETVVLPPHRFSKECFSPGCH